MSKYTLSSLKNISIEKLRSTLYASEDEEKEDLIKKIYNKQKAKIKNTSKHPTYEIMVTKAISELKEHHGSSRHAIKKFILCNYPVNTTYFNKMFNIQIKRLVDKGVVWQPKGYPNSKYKITSEYKQKSK